MRCCEYVICGITIRQCIPADQTCENLVIPSTGSTLVDVCEDCPECTEMLTTQITSKIKVSDGEQ